VIGRAVFFEKDLGEVSMFFIGYAKLLIYLPCPSACVCEIIIIK
jgi:hypothetical protein